MYIFVLKSVVLIEENKEFLEEETKTFTPNSKRILATLKRNIGKGLFMTLIILSKHLFRHYV